MEYLADPEMLEQKKGGGALFILFGGEHCAVCQAIRPRLDEMLEKQFPLMQRVYIDCEKSPEICAQHNVFSLPAVQFYIEGMLATEAARSFGLNELAQKMERPYRMWSEKGTE